MTWEGSEENYNIFRWYRAGWGRYTQPDPLDTQVRPRLVLPALIRQQRIEATRSTYAYAADNPLFFTDPWGLFVVANCGCHPVLASGNPGPGQGSGEQIFFSIPPNCQAYGKNNPVPGTGNPGVTDIDFLYTSTFEKQKIPGNDVLPTIFIYSDCKNGFYSSMNPPGDGTDHTGKIGCCGCDKK